MIQGIDQAFAEIVRREVAAAVEPLRAELERFREASEAEKQPLMPLSAILNCSKRAAIARLARDESLRSLGRRCGRQTLFLKHEVLQYFAARQRERVGGR